MNDLAVFDWVFPCHLMLCVVSSDGLDGESCGGEHGCHCAFPRVIDIAAASHLYLFINAAFGSEDSL